jgi:hypothetical protein
MKRSFLVLGIFGILLMLFGTVFALQGDGILGGSVMSGNPFWIYAGSVVVVFGLILAALGFYLGSKNRTNVPTKVNSGTAEDSGSSKR